MPIALDGVRCLVPQVGVAFEAVSQCVMEVRGGVIDGTLDPLVEGAIQGAETAHLCGTLLERRRSSRQVGLCISNGFAGVVQRCRRRPALSVSGAACVAGPRFAVVGERARLHLAGSVEPVVEQSEIGQRRSGEFCDERTPLTCERRGRDMCKPR